MKYKNIIFDLDGTLLDTSEGIKEAVKYTVQKMGYREVEDNELLDFIGPPIQSSLISHFGCSLDDAQEGAEIFREYYKNVSLLKAEPYGGIYDLLQYIRDNGMSAAVATYKREDYALQLLRAFHFDDFCTVMHGADNYNRFSKADIIKLCMREMSGLLKDTLYVGDTNGDFMGANKCGIKFVGVTYGFGFRANENYSFDTIKEPVELVEKL